MIFSNIADRLQCIVVGIAAFLIVNSVYIVVALILYQDLQLFICWYILGLSTSIYATYKESVFLETLFIKCLLRSTLRLLFGAAGGPTMFICFFIVFHTEYDGYKKIVERDYIFPTKRNKQKDVWRRLGGGV